jgi:hypothetical protein
MKIMRKVAITFMTIIIMIIIIITGAITVKTKILPVHLTNEYKSLWGSLLRATYASRIKIR